MTNLSSDGKDLSCESQVNPLALTPRQIAALFPFHIAFDSSLAIISLGESLMRAAPEIKVGCKLAELFELERPTGPFSFEFIAKSCDFLFLLKLQKRAFRLRGKMLSSSDQRWIVYLCSPWFADPDEFRASGVKFDDFSLHDATPEFVNVSESLRLAVEDLQQVTATLRKQRRDLQKVNLQLQIREAEAQLAYRLTKILVEAPDADSASESIIRTICESLGYKFGSLWRRNKESGKLQSCNCWSVQDLHGSLFDETTKSTSLDGGTGLPGTVWETGTTRCIPDIAKATNFPRGQSALRSGLRSCFAFPICIAGQVRGVMEFFSSSSEEPSASLLEMLVGVGNQIELFVERREIEQERAKILSLLDSILESRTEGILVTDRRGRPIRANERWFELWNLPAQLRLTLDRDSIFEWVKPQFEDPEGRAAVRELLLKNPDQTRLDIFRLNDGRVLEILSTPHKMGDDIMGRLWIYRDITQSHRSQREREELLARLNATMDATTNGILVTDLRGAFVTGNQRFFEMWGLTESSCKQESTGELQALIASQLFNSESFVDRVREMVDGPLESSYDVLHFRDGRIFERYSQPQRMGDQILGRVWSYRDVSAKWRADEALRESEERYRVVAETASDAILCFSEDGRIIFANESAARALRSNAELILQKSVLDLIPNRLLGSYKLQFAEHFGNGRRGIPRQGTELIGKRLDGSEFPMDVSVGESTVSGERMFTVIMRDISSRKATEERLRLAIREAEVANQAKSDFLANISHEIRTPLNSIVGLSELLRTTKLDSDQQDMMNSVSASSESLLHLITDLLDFSKIEAGQVDIESMEFDPVGIVEQALDNLRLRAARKKLPMYLVVDPLGPPHVFGDANRLRQILVNLLGNAVKFTERGHVLVRLSWQREGPSIRLRFCVEDTGIGVPSDVQAQIFQRFFRVDTVVGRRAGGAGLGLSISRLLCEAMGGKLGVESEEGNGSRFILTLDLPSASDLALPEKQPAGVMRVLLLGSPDAIEQERQSLVSAGLKVDAFSCWAAAHAHAQDQAPFDLFVYSSTCGFPLQQVQLLAQLSAVGPEIRTVRLIRTSRAEDKVLRLSGVSADLEYPLTPSRIGKAINELTRDPDQPARLEPAISQACRQQERYTLKLLLTEDNPDGQAYAQRVLQRAGHQVTIAESGSQAIRAAEEGAFDVILMDIMLPDMTGLDATRKIRSFEKLAGYPRTPVIALTAHALQSYRDEAFASDMDEYITKPIRPNTLLDVVQRWGTHTRVVVLSDTANVEQVIVSPLRHASNIQVDTFIEIEEAKGFLAKSDVVLLLLEGEFLEYERIAKQLSQLGLKSPIIAVPNRSWSAREQQTWLGRSGSHIFQLPLQVAMLQQLIREWKESGVRTPRLRASAQMQFSVIEVPEDLSDLIPEYLENVRGELKKVGAMAERQRFADISRIGHNLKGTGRGFGFHKITELGALIEAAASASDANQVKTLASELETWLSVVRWRPAST